MAIEKKETKDQSYVIGCLAREEDEIHQYAISGAINFLNQELMSWFITNTHIRPKEEFKQYICKPKDFSSSLAVLELIMFKKFDLFEEVEEEDPIGRNERTISALIANSSQLFLKYLALLQASTPYSTCLKEEIPEVSEIMDNQRHLLGLKNYDFFLQNKYKILKIFTSLKKFKKIYSDCVKKARLKEKLNNVRNAPNPAL